MYRPASAHSGVWARQVESETARHFYRFRKNPAEFNNSEAYFRVLMLVTVLQQDFNVRCNPAFLQTRGHCPRVAGRYDEARAAYQRASELAPNRPENAVFLALINRYPRSAPEPLPSQSPRPR